VNVRPVRILLIAASVAYPVIIFLSLVYLKVSPRILSLSVFAVALVNFLVFTGERSSGPGRGRTIALSCLLAVLAVAAFVTNRTVVLRFYPVLVGLSLLTVFGFTLVKPPAMILRFALLQDKTLRESADFSAVERYCKKVTIIWCAFFIGNTAIALYTTLYASAFVWSLYNGLISYILMGCLFVGEFIVRKFVRR